MYRLCFLRLLAVSLALSCVSAQSNCDLDNRPMQEGDFDVTPFLSVLSLTIPESCDDFTPIQLLACASELNVVEGCCDIPCRELFAQYSSTCLKDLAAVICPTNATSAVEILNSIASRCDDDYEMLSCGNEQTSPPTPASELAPIPASDEAPVSIPASDEAPISVPESEVAVGPMPESEKSGIAPSEDEDVIAELENIDEDADFNMGPAIETMEADLLSARDAETITPEPCLADRVIDPNVEIAAFLPILARYQLPQSCRNLAAKSSLPCREELEIASGCCNQQCRDAIDEIPEQCLSDLSIRICDNYTEHLFPLSRVAVRCKSGFKIGKCEAANLKVIQDENGYPTLISELPEEEDTDTAAQAQFSSLLLSSLVAATSLVLLLF